MKLHAHQEDLKTAIYKEWEKVPNVLAVAPCGFGKSLVLSNLLIESRKPAVVLAHRAELVFQISNTLARLGIRHNVIAAQSLIKQIIQYQIQNFGKSFYDARSKVHAASVQTLVKKPDLEKMNIGLWITDECFPAGMLVDGKPIETIQVGDMVTAFDERNGTFHKRRVVRLFKNRAPNYMMRLTTERHHVIITTPKHPFWTKRGWVNAGNLTTHDEVLVNDSTMYNLQDKHRTIKKSGDNFQEIGAGVLLKRTSFDFHAPSEFGNNAPNKFKIRVGTNDQKKSDAQRGLPFKSVGNFKENATQAANSRRKRKTRYPIRTSAKCTFGRFKLSSAIHFTNKHDQNKRTAATKPFQNRFSQPFFKNSYRNRRGESLHTSATSPRLEENHIFNWSRLASVEIQESRSIAEPIGNHVYNLEVDELHTYTANGVVVHNCHHLVKGSTWDKCIQRFQNAKGVGFTATPVRADGKGLSRDSHGLFDSMVEGLGARELIEMKYLADYKIYAPATNLDLSSVKIGSGGDYVLEQLREATHKSGIMGDTVRNYQKFAMGKRALVFAVDVESSHQIAKAFNDAGIPAAGVDGTTDPLVRARALRRLESGEILVIVNCDLFGEGTDIPSVEVGIFARKTASFTLFYQQFFRAGRIDKDNHGKVAIIIDQVGNVAHHGLPDAYRVWSMAAADKRERCAVKTTVRTCPMCTGVYEISLHGRTCPYCGETQEPQGRTTPEQVDGDLSELSPDVLAMLRKAGEPVLKLPYGASKPIEMRLRRLHGERLETITAVRDSIALWAAGKDDTRRAQREFYRDFGVDVLTAQTLPTSEMLNLISKIVTDAL